MSIEFADVFLAILSWEISLKIDVDWCVPCDCFTHFVIGCYIGKCMICFFFLVIFFNERTRFANFFFFLALLFPHKARSSAVWLIYIQSYVILDFFIFNFFFSSSFSTSSFIQSNFPLVEMKQTNLFFLQSSNIWLKFNKLFIKQLMFFNWNVSREFSWVFVENVLQNCHRFANGIMYFMIKFGLNDEKLI